MVSIVVRLCVSMQRVTSAFSLLSSTQHQRSAEASEGGSSKLVGSRSAINTGTVWMDVWSAASDTHTHRHFTHTIHPSRSLSLPILPSFLLPSFVPPSLTAVMMHGVMSLLLCPYISATHPSLPP